MRLHKSTLMDITWIVFFAINFAHQSLFKGIHILSIVMILCVSLYCSNFRIRFIRNKKIFFWYLLFTLYMFLSQLWAIGINETSNVLDVSWRTAVTVLCICMYIESEEKYKRILKYFTLTTVYFIIVYIITSPPSTWRTTAMGEYTGQFRNFAGYTACFGALASAYFFKSQVKLRVFYIICTVICVIGAVLTGSRKVYIQIAMAIVLYVWLERSLKKRSRNIALLLGLCSLVLFALYNTAMFQTFVNEKILTMFIPDNFSYMSQYALDAAASTRARRLLAQSAMEMFKMRPIAGCGVDSVRYYIRNYRRDLKTSTYSHNNYTEVLACFGIIGFLLYYLRPLKCGIRAFKKARSENSSLIWKYLTIFFVSYLVLDYASISYYYILTISLITINMCGTMYES